MCNAYNHPFNCTCGWGGDGHTGRSDGTTNASIDYFKRNDDVSYLYPNAKCPVCGASVYFYKSENGGRVFFDDLGPPWPKHPCTDINYNKVDIIRHSRMGRNQWQKDGWTPVLIEQNSRKSLFSYQISRLDNKISSRLEKIIYASEFENCCKADVLNQARQIDNTILQISSYSISMEKQEQFEINYEPNELKKFFVVTSFNKFFL